jgi:hypothetical protein
VAKSSDSGNQNEIEMKQAYFVTNSRNRFNISHSSNLKKNFMTFLNQF